MRFANSKGILAAVAVALILPSTIFADEAAVMLSRKLKAGETIKHKFLVTANVNGADVVVRREASTKIVEIKPDGKVVVETQDLAGKVEFGGMEMEVPAVAAVTTVRDKQGKILEFKMAGSEGTIMSSEVMHIMAAISEIAFPENAVKPAESWTTEYDNPAAKGKKFTLKGTFVGMEKVDGVDCWKVKQAGADIEAEGNKVGIEMTCFFDASNGRMVKTEANIKDIPTQFGALTFTVKLDLVKS